MAKSRFKVPKTIEFMAIDKSMTEKKLIGNCISDLHMAE